MYQNGRKPLCTVALLFEDRRHGALSFSTPPHTSPGIRYLGAGGLIGGDEQVSLTCSSTVFLPFAVACDICFLHLNEHVSGLMTECGFATTATGERPQRG